jgi:DMSO/TMAO reductase YedYZ molybdopterin-dependent catalytic subunit
MSEYSPSKRQLFLRAARSLMPESLSGDAASLHAPISLLPHVDESGYTPTQFFFRQQIGQSVEIDPLYWSIRLHGLVQMPLALTLGELKALSATEVSCTIACDGIAARNSLIGHGLWRGVPIRDLLEQVGLLPQALYAYISAADGYTTSLPVDALAQAVLAYEFNGDVLPRDHGYPARLIAPGSYGYKMPKWIRHIEFTRSPPIGFWESRGAAMSGQVEPLAMIFRPHHLQSVRGKVSIGGIAFAGMRDIVAVEISIDDAAWMPVAFDPAQSFSWTPWQIEWNPPAPGDYSIQVRVNTSMGTSDVLHSVVIRVE